jgi:hypothetical protein
MSEKTIELLHRNLHEVFGENEATRRRTAINELYTDDAVVHLADGTVTGHDAIDTLAGDLRADHPHFVYTPHGAAQVAQNGGVLAWGSGPAGEAPVYTGLDFIMTRAGKIAALYVFLNIDLG